LFCNHQAKLVGQVSRLYWNKEKKGLNNQSTIPQYRKKCANKNLTVLWLEVKKLTKIVHGCI
jgi:hypothetical protein